MQETGGLDLSSVQVKLTEDGSQPFELTFRVRWEPNRLPPPRGYFHLRLLDESLPEFAPFVMHLPHGWIGKARGDTTVTVERVQG